MAEWLIATSAILGQVIAGVVYYSKLISTVAVIEANQRAEHLAAEKFQADLREEIKYLRDWKHDFGPYKMLVDDHAETLKDHEVRLRVLEKERK